MTSAHSSRDAVSARGNSTRKLIVIVLSAVLGFAMLWLLLRAASGSSGEDINAEYGRRHGAFANDSVNGTTVLAAMFEKRGYDVITWRKLSPKLQTADTIVWFPDDVQPPTEEQRKWLEEWLTAGYNRTLIYVGRDYDAEITYWEQVLPGAPGDQQAKIKRRLGEAKQRHQKLHSGMPNNEDADWFVTRANKTRRAVASLDGDWAAGVNATKTWIEVEGLLDEPENADYQSEVLLRSQGDPLVIRVQEATSYNWGEGKIIVVANGSFLLNLSLVNPEHRRLAGTLIDHCGGETVAFVESGSTSPLRIRDVDYESQNQAWYNMLTVWPINAVILHIAASGIVICFAMFPIFGRPHTATDNAASDFGKHIDAFGKLLAKTQDSEYALARLAYYEETVKRDSGASHGD